MRKEEKCPEDEVQAAIIAAKALTNKYESEGLNDKPEDEVQSTIRTDKALKSDAEPLIPHWRAVWSAGELVEQESFGPQFSAEELLSVLKDQD